MCIRDRPQTGYGYEFTSYEELWEAFCTQMRYFLDMKIRGNLVIEKIYAREMPDVYKRQSLPVTE